MRHRGVGDGVDENLQCQLWSFDCCNRSQIPTSRVAGDDDLAWIDLKGTLATKECIDDSQDLMEPRWKRMLRCQGVVNEEHGQACGISQVSSSRRVELGGSKHPAATMEKHNDAVRGKFVWSDQNTRHATHLKWNNACNLSTFVRVQFTSRLVACSRLGNGHFVQWLCFTCLNEFQDHFGDWIKWHGFSFAQRSCCSTLRRRALSLKGMVNLLSTPLMKSLNGNFFLGPCQRGPAQFVH